MSAFMLDKTHIDLLIDVALFGPSDSVGRGQWYQLYVGNPLKQLNEITADEVGEMLVRENLASINYRYPDTISNPDDIPGPIAQYWRAPYRHQDHSYRMTTIEALSAIACYEYQSCEHPTWETSQAYAFCRTLQNRLISCLPGWDAAPWGWGTEQIKSRRTFKLVPAKRPVSSELTNADLP